MNEENLKRKMLSDMKFKKMIRFLKDEKIYVFTLNNIKYYMKICNDVSKSPTEIIYGFLRVGDDKGFISWILRLTCLKYGISNWVYIEENEKRLMKKWNLFLERY